MKTLSHLLILVLTFGSCHAYAQSKGSFDTTVSFLSENRTLSCYVPNDYDSTKSYHLMVALHGLGDNSANYRNALVSSLNWPAVFPNTIIVCPDGGSDQNKDFYQPAGDENIIHAAIGYIRENYAIDTTHIVLQGFSLGGRSALKYGLEHTDVFKALLLNTPAIQGILDLQNTAPASLGFSYENGSRIPVFLTVGEDDVTYADLVKALSVVLKKNNTPLMYVPVKGLGHTLPANGVTATAAAFFEQPGISASNADLFLADVNAYSCSKDVQVNCFVRNTGSAPLHSVDLLVKAGEQSVTHNWTGTLEPFEHLSIPVPFTTTAGGRIHIRASIVATDSSDSDTSDNLAETQTEVLDGTGLTQSTEGFDTEDPSWNIPATPNLFGWYIDTDVKASGAASVASFNCPLIFNTMGARERFSSPYIDVAALPKKTLSFAYAFNYLRYTPPYTTADQAFADTLEISISTDCGQTYQELFRKGGAELATAESPILNALSIQQCIFTPGGGEWNIETIDLTSFASAHNAIIRFTCISGMGGTMYIDNISAGSVTLAVNELATSGNSFTLFPNPASDHLVIETREIPELIRVYDLSGRMVLEQTGNAAQQTRISLAGLTNGMYVLETRSGQHVQQQKFIVTK